MARVPDSAQLRTCVLALGLALLALAVWEGWLRQHNIEVALPDAEPIAAQAVANPPAKGSSRILIMGSSRVQAGIDPATLETELVPGWDGRNLGLSTCSGALQLELSLSHVQRGDIIVVGVFPRAFYTGFKSYALTRYESLLPQTGGLAEVELAVTRELRGRLLFVGSTTSPLEESRLATRTLLGMEQVDRTTPGIRIVHDNGWRSVNLPLTGFEFRSGFDREGASQVSRRARPDRLDSFEVILEQLKQNFAEAKQLGARGVFFVRMPSDHEFGAAEESYYPRSRFWERLSAAFPNHCWHFADAEATRNLQTFDGSHLSEPAALIYSRWLGKRLREALTNHE